MSNNTKDQATISQMGEHHDLSISSFPYGGKDTKNRESQLPTASKETPYSEYLLFGPKTPGNSKSDEFGNPLFLAQNPGLVFGDGASVLRNSTPTGFHSAAEPAHGEYTNSPLGLPTGNANKFSNQFPNQFINQIADFAAESLEEPHASENLGESVSGAKTYAWIPGTGYQVLNSANLANDVIQGSDEASESISNVNAHGSLNQSLQNAGYNSQAPSSFGNNFNNFGALSPLGDFNFAFASLDTDFGQSFDLALHEGGVKFDQIPAPFLYSQYPTWSYNNAHVNMTTSPGFPTVVHTGPTALPPTTIAASGPAPTIHLHRCSFGTCTKRFKRPTDLARHQYTVHLNMTGRLCPIAGCPKSQGRGYSRADKVTEHLWKKHGDLGYRKA